MFFSFIRYSLPPEKKWLVLGLVLLCWPTLSRANFCGDVNFDGDVNVGDAVILINVVFKSHPLPDPVELGDVNHDGSINAGDIVYLIGYAFRGGPVPSCPISIGPIETSDCKGWPVDSAGLECVRWEYNGMGVLTVHRFNVGLNCCPGTIRLDQDFLGDTLTIREYESYDDGGPCHCLCAFNISYQVMMLPPGEYTIVFLSLNMAEGDAPDAPVSFHVVVGSEASQGETCQARSCYPWVIPND